MSERLDAMVPRKRNEKTYWVRIGSAWPNKNGIGYQIVLDALPLPDDKGRVVINLFVPKQQDARSAPKRDHQAPLGDMDPDDSVPF